MTSPATEPASTPVTAGTPVLSARPLFYKIPPADLPRFGDDRWDLWAAVRDQHYAHAICWAQYPEPFREDAKLYALTLLTAVDDAPALRRARSQVPSVKTIISDLNCLSVFLRWLASRHITRFCDATAADLDGYLHHVQDLLAISSTRRRMLLIAVQRLHAYRELLPARCQLPGACLWQGASAAELASDPGPRTGENRTPRIHPDVMEPLLSAALLTAGTIAADLLPAGRRLFELRALAGQLGSGRERRSGHLSYQAATEYLHDLLAELASRGLPLPGQRDEHGQLVTDTRGLAIAARFFPRFLTTSRAQQLLAGSGLPLQQDMLRVTRFSPAAGHPWRTAHADTKTLLSLLRHVITACFVTTAYLSGARTGEVLNLRRGCITRDDALGLVFMSGSQLKAGESRRERSPATIPWVVTGQTAQAVGVLEELFSSDLLFPGGWFFTGSWFTEPDRPATRRSFRISTDIASFITWFNTTVATVTGHPAIPADDHGTITAPRLRRTLAWHIVRRPGGTIAGATQYGHFHTQLIQGYAGVADSGFADEIAFETYLLRAETLHDDAQRLAAGEHVSGPAAASYRDRVSAAASFAGTTITSPAQARSALANPALNIHHGDLLTCIWNPQTAACRSPGEQDSTPNWPRCRPSCANIARTGRDADALTREADRLQAQLDGPAIPQPLRDRLQQRLRHYRDLLAAHHGTSPAAEPEPAARP